MAKQTVEEMWEQMLTGSYPRLHGMRKIWGALPSPPRCKLCNAPFSGFGGILMRAIAYGPSPLNRRLCKWCIRAMHKHPGGAEVDVSVLFADVRGSTGIAERMPPADFSRLLARFYGAAAEVIDEQDGIVDKFVGDGAVAFHPRLCGKRPCGQRDRRRPTLARADRQRRKVPWIPVGVAVHTGRSFVGAVGEGDARDFTALGDAVNTTARLTGLAGAGET